MFTHRLKTLNLKKQKAFWVISIISLALVIFCSIQILLPNKQFRYEGSCTFQPGTITTDTVVYGGIPLRPGVYYVELSYDTDTDLGALCTLKDGSVFHGGLLTNGEHVYSGLHKTGFHAWLFESTDNMSVTISYNGVGSLQTTNLVITETNQLWTMLLTIILAFTAVAFCILIFTAYNKQYPVAQEKKNVFFTVMLISLLASLPYLLDCNISGADLTYHLQRIEGVKDGFLSGQFPTRLEPEWVYEHGYANAIFYCNALLIFPAILRLLGFTVTTSYNIYCIALNIATAWISYYCYSRIFKNYKIGLALSGLYTLSFFRIYKLVMTSATGEGSAVTFMPLVLYGFYRIFTEDYKDKRYQTAWVPTAIGFAGLMQTHVLTCEITGFLTTLLCLICIRRIFKKQIFLALLKSAGAAVGLSLWYLVPFLDFYLTQDVHIKHVAARTIQDRGLYFAQLLFHFWKHTTIGPSEETGMYQSYPVGIGFTLFFGLCIFLILWFSGRLRDKKQPLIIFAKTASLLGGLLLLMSLRIFPWDKIQFLSGITASLVSSLQFPNRFLGWGTALLIAVFGFCLWYFEKQERKLSYYAGVILTLISITTSSMYLLDSIIQTENRYSLYNEESMGFGYISGAEYLLEGTDEDLLTFVDGAKTGEGVTASNYQKDYLHVQLTASNTSTSESYVDIPLLYYKVYRAYNTDTGEALSLCAGENNVIRVLLPAQFSGRVDVKFVSPFYWRISEIITVATMLLMAAFACANQTRRNTAQ